LKTAYKDLGGGGGDFIQFDFKIAYPKHHCKFVSAEEEMQLCLFVSTHVSLKTVR
jgi:hypothetical protein